MMDATRQSLLLRAQHGDPSAWQHLVAVYRPLIRHWLRRQGVHPQDGDDLTQDVLAILTKELPRFQHAGRPGSFRGWLRTITVNRARAFWRAGRCRTEAAGGTAFLDLLKQLEDATSDQSKKWDAEHDQAVCRRLLKVLEQDFKPSSVQAFRRLVFDGASGAEVAAELGMTRAAVFMAQSRVLRRLREEAAGLLD
jgi:RNA polymerase sigma-70 factor (ECF subfamily)